MNGNLMYEMAKSRIAEQERRAIAAGEARRQRAEARKHRKSRDAESVVPSIPDYAEELLEVAQETVPAPREEVPNGRHARSGR